MEHLTHLLETFGEVNGLLIIGILSLFLLVRKLNKRIHKQHDDQLADKQQEIERLAKENHEYRDRFLAILDKRFSDETDR
ncbi:MAG: hypothetical protein IBGAMO2_460023 [Arenicellales bacterium IbO2]|nr:hypothetical protein [Gammaproteobacteria bacterium]CAJ2376814.1 MAG: hypothetical protein IBGAMO2_460023 [Arenicellales bacterium IbO2]